MPPVNMSRPSSMTFLLLGIPGLEHLHVWIGIPFCSMYVVAVVGNVTILAVVRAERSLHEPMFLFLCMLSITDLVLSTSTLPRMLCLFWFGARDIAFDACLTQMFFIHSFTTMESGFFLAMAIDRYVAICDPLHHTTILTHSRIIVIGIIVVIRGVAFFTPHPILLKQLPYCRSRIIAHTYCEFMAVAKLACMDTGSTKRYSLSMASIIGASDAILTAVSYAFILRSVFRLPSREASFKALGTCGSHVCVILVFYSTAGFSIFTHRFGKNVPAHIHIFIANMYLLVPPFLNPIVYGVRTKKIRENVFRALGFKVA
ncbi:olfactory receptor 52K2-like [Echinops telfairi]|uniref:Olfactory receptor 52K2-like n=1 Tax=Echinops telfairi TaxID=9371 RepID=A0ABM0J936_ECHTE|nr:olfactory receptor 52K2-like [Echinops telfairi]